MVAFLVPANVDLDRRERLLKARLLDVERIVRVLANYQGVQEAYREEHGSCEEQLRRSLAKIRVRYVWTHIGQMCFVLLFIYPNI